MVRVKQRGAKIANEREEQIAKSANEAVARGAQWARTKQQWREGAQEWVRAEPGARSRWERNSVGGAQCGARSPGA